MIFYQNQTTGQKLSPSIKNYQNPMEQNNELH